MLSLKQLYNLIMLNIIIYSTRWICRKTIHYSVYLFLIEELVYSCEICGLMVEIASQTKGFSLHLLTGFSYCLSLWWHLVSGSAIKSNVNYWEKFIIGEVDNVVSIAAIVMGQFIIGHFDWLFKLAIYNTMRMIYRYGYVLTIEDTTPILVCSSELKVTALQGALIEAGLVFIERLNIYMARNYFICRSLLWQTLLNVGLVLLAVNSIGFFFNPVIATIMQYECSDYSTLDFFLVYWLGNIFGCVMAHYFYILFLNRPYVKKSHSYLHILSKSSSGVNI